MNAMLRAMATNVRNRRLPDPKAAREAAVARGGIGEGTTGWDALPTDEKLRRYTADGQDALTRSVRATVDGALPAFDQRLQGIRESARARGISNGDTAGGYERQLADDFERNIANAIAGGSMDLYQTGLDRLYGYRDFSTAKSNAKAQSRANLWGAVGGLAGAYLGGK